MESISELQRKYIKAGITFKWLRRANLVMATIFLVAFVMEGNYAAAGAILVAIIWGLEEAL